MKKDENNNELKVWFRIFCIQQGCSVSSFAINKLHVSKSYISQILNLERPITLETIDILRNEYHISQKDVDFLTPYTLSQTNQRKLDNVTKTKIKDALVDVSNKIWEKYSSQKQFERWEGEVKIPYDEVMNIINKKIEDVCNG